MSCIASAVSRWIASGATLRNVCAVRLEGRDALGGEQPVRRLVRADRQQVGVAELGIGQPRAPSAIRRTRLLRMAVSGERDAGPARTRRQLRISDAERHQVAEILREAAGEGRHRPRRARRAAGGDVRRSHLRRPGADHRSTCPSSRRPAGSRCAPAGPASPLVVAGPGQREPRRDPRRASTARASGWSRSSCRSSR